MPMEVESRQAGSSVTTRNPLSVHSRQLYQTIHRLASVANQKNEMLPTYCIDDFGSSLSI